MNIMYIVSQSFHDVAFYVINGGNSAYGWAKTWINKQKQEKQQNWNWTKLSAIKNMIMH